MRLSFYLVNLGKLLRSGTLPIDGTQATLRCLLFPLQSSKVAAHFSISAFFRAASPGALLFVNDGFGILE